MERRKFPLGTALLSVFLFLSCVPAYCRGIRIISLTPSTTEMLFAIGAGNQVVGVTTADDYPPVVKKLPKVGGVDLDDEKVLALRPDLVVGEGDLVGAALSRLKKLGVKTVALHTRTLEDIPQTLVLLGKVTGHREKGALLARTFRATVAEIAARARSFPHPRVFLELGSRPLLTTGRGTFLSELIADAGGKNIAANLPKGFQMISPEVVVADDPEIIIAADGTTSREIILRRSGWGGISAVVHKRVYPINPDLIDRPGPRILQGLKEIFAWLHPL